MIITTSGATFSDAGACAAPCSAAIVTVFLVVNILLILPVDSGVIFPCVLDYFVLLYFVYAFLNLAHLAPGNDLFGSIIKFTTHCL